MDVDMIRDEHSIVSTVIECMILFYVGNYFKNNDTHDCIFEKIV